MIFRLFFALFLTFTAFNTFSQESPEPGLNEQSPEQVERWVVTFFDAFNTYVRPGQLDQWMTHWSDGAKRYTPMGDAEGKNNIRKLYEDLISRYENMDQKIIGLVVQGNRASVELMTKGTHKATGVEVSIPNVALLTFDADGRVAKARVYFDSNYVASQIPAKK